MGCERDYKIMSIATKWQQDFTIAIIGRPNVGKSSLINRLTRSHSAVVSDIAGTTLDIQYLPIMTEKGTVLLLDTAGWLDNPDALMDKAMKKLINVLKDVDLIWFVVDGRSELTPLDWQVREIINKCNKPIKVLANKIDNPQISIDPDIWRLGFKDVLAISAKAGFNMRVLEEEICKKTEHDLDYDKEDSRIKIALIGKPNTGKSTLFNQWVEEDIQIVSDIAGTTRDSHAYPILIQDQEMLLVDTAGLRRNSKRADLELIFAQHSERSILSADICVALVRADEQLTEQDTRLLKQVHKKARGMVIALTQYDRLINRKNEIIQEIQDLLSDWYPMIECVPYSIFDKNCQTKLQKAILRSARSIEIEFTTSKLTKILEELIEMVQPPCTSVSRIKPRFAHPCGHGNTIVVKGKQVEDLPLSYRRYLEKGFLNAMGLNGRPINVILKNDNNPYANKQP